MKTKQAGLSAPNPVVFVLLLAVIGWLMYGCATEKTLVPAKPAVTNLDGTITAAVPAVKTNVPNETVTKIVDTGKQVTPFIPAPWGTVVNGVLGLLTVGAGLFAGIKNNQLNNANAATETIVAGVEAAGELAGAVKAAIAKQALADGTADAVHAVVKKVTPQV
jgi:hypothetical protein